PLRKILAADIFEDGWLDPHDVYEHETHETMATWRCLTDGVNFLWVLIDPNGFTQSFTRYAGNVTDKILAAISKAFDVDIVSEHEPQYWGFKSYEEWDAAWEEMEADDAR